MFRHNVFVCFKCFTSLSMPFFSFYAFLLFLSFSSLSILFFSFYLFLLFLSLSSLQIFLRSKSQRFHTASPCQFPSLLCVLRRTDLQVDIEVIMFRSGTDGHFPSPVPGFRPISCSDRVQMALFLLLYPVFVRFPAQIGYRRPLLLSCTRFPSDFPLRSGTDRHFPSPVPGSL